MTRIRIRAGIIAITIACSGIATGMSPLPETLDSFKLPEGWVHAKNYQFFDTKTLYGYINGESETFFPFGFEQLTVFEVHPEGNPSEQVSLEVYAMGSKLDAFGIYSTYRQPSDDFVEIGNEGFIGDTQLVFYQDKYFVKVHFLQLSDDKAHLKSVARAVSTALPEPGDRPAALAVMDLPGLQPRTVKYLARSVLGQAQFPRGLQAEIAAEDSETPKDNAPAITVTLIICESDAAAEKALAAYVADLKMFDGVVRSDETPEGNVNVVTDPDFERGLIAREGRHLIFYTTAPAAADVSAEPFNLLRERVRGEQGSVGTD